MYVFIFHFSFIKHAQILLSRKCFSTSLFFFFFNEGPKINEGFFLKQNKKKTWPKQCFNIFFSSKSYFSVSIFALCFFYLVPGRSSGEEYSNIKGFNVQLKACSPAEQSLRFLSLLP